MDGKNDIVELAADIVAAYVGNNTVPVTDLPGLINEVCRALSSSAGEPGSMAEMLVGRRGDLIGGDLRPAVPVKRSIQPDYLICLEDGKKFKSLKRHLRAQYNMTPEQYRERWGLPADYPMVAPNYASERSRLAREMGLGTARRKSA